MTDLARNWVAKVRRRRLARVLRRNLRWVAETHDTSPVWAESDWFGADPDARSDSPGPARHGWTAR
jgi:hypothetical protein